MKPNEIYAMVPQEMHHDLTELRGFCFDHLPECPEEVDMRRIPAQTEVEIRVIKEFRFDHRRFWRLSTAWFRGKPVMVIQNAGREGDDHRRRIVTDQTALMEMARYVCGLYHPTERPFVTGDESTLAQPDEDVPGLTEFYGDKLDGYFRPHAH